MRAAHFVANSSELFLRGAFLVLILIDSSVSVPTRYEEELACGAFLYLKGLLRCFLILYD